MNEFVDKLAKACGATRHQQSVRDYIRECASTPTHDELQRLQVLALSALVSIERQCGKAALITTVATLHRNAVTRHTMEHVRFGGRFGGRHG